MEQPNYSVVLSALIVGTPASVTVGDCLIPSGTGNEHLLATAENRASAGRMRAAAGIALTSGRNVKYQTVGPCPPSITGLGTGTASDLRVSSAGRLERAVINDGDVYAGQCDEDGFAYLNFATTAQAVISVANDVDKTASTIDRVRGINKLALQTAAGAAVTTSDNPPTGGAWVRVGTALIPDHPTPQDVYDPRHYGAKFDGITDDLPALQATIAAMPQYGGTIHIPAGVAWLSDMWRISKPVLIKGVSRFGITSGFRVAPGKTAIRFEGVFLSGAGSGDGSRIQDVAFFSQILVHWNVTGGGTGGLGIEKVYSNGATFRKGDLYTKISGNNTRFFRAGAQGTFGNSEPSWNLTVGGTTTVNGVTFTTEAAPTVYAASTTYSQGDVVFAPADNRYYFVCEVGGTSSGSGSTPDELKGGDNIVGAVIDGTVIDNNITWRVRIATGVLVCAEQVKVNGIYVQGFTGPAFAVVGGLGAIGGVQTFANFAEINGVDARSCGLGGWIHGSDANGWKVGHLTTISTGMRLPTPTIATNAVTSHTTLGGHHFVHKSGGGWIGHGYAQTQTGRSFLITGNSYTVIDSCRSELTNPCWNAHATGGYVISIGGTIVWDTNGLITDIRPEGGTGIRERDVSGASTLWTQLTGQDGRNVYEFWAVESGDNSYFGLKYNAPATGWWALQHQATSANDAYAISSAKAGLSYGPGWFCLPLGHYLGRPGTDTPMFVGHQGAWKSALLRQGERKAGDIFRSQTTTTRVLKDGTYRAVPWATGAYSVGVAAKGLPPNQLEPTANTGKTEGGEKVFRTTTAGTSSGPEPTAGFSSATTPGVDTVADGTAVHTYIGVTPPTSNEQFTEKARDQVRRLTKQTTTATASQVIHDGGVVDGVDMALPDNAMMIVRDTITLKKASTGNGGKIVIESVWVRNGGAPSQISTSDITYKLSGSTLDGTTVAHVANGNRIELQGSPESAETLNWRVKREHFEGVD